MISRGGRLQKISQNHNPDIHTSHKYQNFNNNMIIVIIKNKYIRDGLLALGDLTNL